MSSISFSENKYLLCIAFSPANLKTNFTSAVNSYPTHLSNQCCSLSTNRARILQFAPCVMRLRPRILIKEIQFEKKVHAVDALLLYYFHFMLILK